MGIPGLWKWCFGGDEDLGYVSKKLSIKAARKEEIIVIDGFCIQSLPALSRIERSSALFDFAKQTEVIQNFFKAFKKLNYRVVVFFDGCRNRSEMEKWRGRKKRLAKVYQKIVTTFGGDGSASIPASEYIELMLELGVGYRVLTNVCQRSGVEVFMCEAEVEGVLASWARENEAFAVIARNSELLIHEISRLIDVSTIEQGADGESMTCKCVERSSFVNFLGLHPKVLFGFAVMRGYDYLQHCSILSMHHTIKELRKMSKSLFTSTSDTTVDTQTLLDRLCSKMKLSRQVVQRAQAQYKAVNGGFVRLCQNSTTFILERSQRLCLSPGLETRDLNMKKMFLPVRVHVYNLLGLRKVTEMIENTWPTEQEPIQQCIDVKALAKHHPVQFDSNFKGQLRRRRCLEIAKWFTKLPEMKEFMSQTQHQALELQIAKRRKYPSDIREEKLKITLDDAILAHAFLKFVSYIRAGWRGEGLFPLNAEVFHGPLFFYLCQNPTDKGNYAKAVIANAKNSRASTTTDKPETKTDKLETKSNINRRAIVCRTRLRSDHQLESRYNTSLGKTYDATVIGIKDFGAWVNIRVIPSARGHFIHATRIGSPHRYLTSVAEEVHIGQTIKAKVVGIDEKNRLQLERVFDSA